MNLKSFFRISLITWALITAFSSCNYEDGVQVVNAGNQFSIAVPNWMKKVDDLKPGAPFQYANRYRNFYAIGTAENKSKPADEMMHDNLEILRKSLKGPVVTDSTGVTINGLKGIRVEIYGKMSDENIYFSEVVLEGPAAMYHVSVWTRGEDRKLRFKPTINEVLNSFKIIP